MAGYSMTRRRPKTRVTRQGRSLGLQPLSDTMALPSERPVLPGIIAHSCPSRGAQAGSLDAMIRANQPRLS